MLGVTSGLIGLALDSVHADAVQHPEDSDCGVGARRRHHAATSVPEFAPEEEAKCKAASGYDRKLSGLYADIKRQQRLQLYSGMAEKL